MTTDMGGGTGTRATEATEALDGFTAFAEATLLVSPVTIFFQVEGLFGHLNLPGRWSRSLTTLHE